MVAITITWYSTSHWLIRSITIPIIIKDQDNIILLFFKICLALWGIENDDKKLILYIKKTISGSNVSRWISIHKKNQPNNIDIIITVKNSTMRIK
jgi:hypothetical protein